VLLTLGVFGILDAAGWLDSATTIDRWWPLAIIGLGLVAMIVERRITLGPAIVVAIGAVLLAGTLGWTEEDLIGPALLLGIGLVVLFGARRRRAREPGEGRPGDSVVMFGGAKIKERSEHLTHSAVSAIFGGATLDLREAHIDDRATIDALALFGGVDVLVPRGWHVSLGGLPIFGGYEDKTEGNGGLPADAPELDVHATAIFGGVNVKNAPD
jgi:hypothetical protein